MEKWQSLTCPAVGGVVGVQQRQQQQVMSRYLGCGCLLPALRLLVVLWGVQQQPQQQLMSIWAVSYLPCCWWWCGGATAAAAAADEEYLGCLLPALLLVVLWRCKSGRSSN